MALTEREIERLLLALVSASVASMKQAVGVLAALDAAPSAPTERSPVPAAQAHRTAEAMIAYQRGYQAALLDVARAAGCPCTAVSSHPAPRADRSLAVDAPHQHEASSLAEFLEGEYLALGICVGPGWDV